MKTTTLLALLGLCLCGCQGTPGELPPQYEPTFEASEMSDDSLGEADDFLADQSEPGLE